MSEISNPRFVLLHHQFPNGDSRDEHWDLMLEQAGYLMTWALAELPRPERTIKASRLANHRMAYLDYEGPISNNRGWVSRVAKGSYKTLAADEGLSFLLSFGDQQWKFDIMAQSSNEETVTISVT